MSTDIRTPAAVHTALEPSILYFGTPVVLISSCDEDGVPNLAPMSSAFWLGWRAVLGLGTRSKTARNLLATGECVLNLPSDALAHAVDRLALTTQVNPVPERKYERGYRYVEDKFGQAGLTAVPSETVTPPRAAECPVAMEAVLERHHPVDDGGTVAFEVRVQRVWVHEDIRTPGTDDHIDPDAWRPLIMNFQQLYGLGPRLRPSALATIPERYYRSDDVDRARAIPTRGSQVL